MLAVSFISTMKVDWPRERSSFAPTRVKMRSTNPISALAAGTKLPICAIKHDQRHLPDVGRFARHVRAGDDREPRFFAIQLGVVRHELFLGQILVEHRMASVADDQVAASR